MNYFTVAEGLKIAIASMEAELKNATDSMEYAERSLTEQLNDLRNKRSKLIDRIAEYKRALAKLGD